MNSIQEVLLQCPCSGGGRSLAAWAEPATTERDSRMNWINGHHVVVGVVATIALAIGAACAGGCTDRSSSTTMVAVESTDNSPAWYYFDWMATAEYAPVFHVRDTESSLGPYASEAKTIALKDLVKMHGHPCDGLVTAACAMKLGLNELYPDGVIDRTDTSCITNNSPCYGDVAAYLTGGRIRFGTQKIDERMGNEFILYRISTQKAVKVSLKDGVFPKDVADLETKIRKGDFVLEEMRFCQKKEWDYARKLLNRPLENFFTVEVLEDFTWQPDPYIHRSSRGDIVNKNVKYEN